MIVVMTDVYQMVDTNYKVKDNCLTVDFYFNNDIDILEATEQIDELVSLADDDESFTFTSHRPAIYTVSPMSDIADKVK